MELMMNNMGDPGLRNNEFNIGRRYENSSALIEKSLKEGEDGFDKVFITGEVQEQEGDFIIRIGDGAPTAILNDRYRQMLGAENSPTVSEMRQGMRPGLSLISGGTNLWANKGNQAGLICIKRDEQAPAEKNKYTSAAGRCSEVPSQTCLNEENEEFAILRKRLENGKSSLRVVNFAYDDSSEQQIQEIENSRIAHLKETRAFLGELLKFWANQPESDLRASAESELKSKISYIERIEGFDVVVTEKSKKGCNIITEVNNNEIDRLSGFAFLDQANNTLEIRTISTIPPEYELVYILDGDTNFHEKTINFDPTFSSHIHGGREIKIFTPDELRSKEVVPALQRYLETL